MGSPSAPKVPNAAKSYEQGIQVYLKYLPQLLQAEQDARTQYDPQRIAEQQQLQDQYGPTQYQQQLDAFNQFDPNYIASRNLLNTTLNNELSAGSSLTPEESQQAESYIRAAQAARGNVLGNAPVSAEALYKGQLGQQLLQQRISNMQGFLAAPTVAQEVQAVAPVSADRSFSFVNPNAGYQGQNYALQNYQNILGAQAIGNSGNPWGSALGGAASGAAIGTSIYPGIGTALGAIAGGVGGYFTSDRRLKDDVEWVGVENGHNIYRFKYVGQDETEWEGVMADEVAGSNPFAVFDGPGGFALVNYEALGLQMRKVV